MASTDHSRALPLLSGIAPRMESASSDPNCHRCNREFGMLTRRKICNHCGFQYCGSCCDHQALCPRSDRSGYEAVLVCTYCIDMLSITACGKSQLRGMPIARIRNYLDAYGIKPKSAIEKDDLIEAIIDARGLNGCLSYEQEQYYRRQTIAKRPPTSESRHRNIFSSTPRPSAPVPPPRPRSTDPTVQRPGPTSAPTSRTPVPPVPPSTRTSDPYLQTHYHQQSYHAQTPISPPRYERAPPVSTTWSPPISPQPRSPQHQGMNMNNNNMNNNMNTSPPHSPPPRGMNMNASPPPQPRWQTRPQSPPPQPPPENSRPPMPGRTRSRSVPSSEGPPNLPNQRPPPPPPPPSSRPRAPQPIPLLSSLLDKSREDISHLNIAMLKGVLQANHVNARMILEKSELVDKVMTLIQTERRDRAREQAIHEAEERAAIEQQRQRMEQLRADAERRASASASASAYSSSSSAPSRARSPPPTRPTSPRPTYQPPPSTGFIEREGLCVVCQDEEANVAVVDCGHLALCMGCSDIIMKSTRECPLCRTRIVTEQRLLRIFKS